MYIQLLLYVIDCVCKNIAFICIVIFPWMGWRHNLYIYEIKLPFDQSS